MPSQFSIGPERYRLGSSAPADASAPTRGAALTALPTPTQTSESRPWHPSSPMFAVAVIGALTFGLMAVSTSGGVSVRVGKAVAGVSGAAGVGNTK